MGSATLVATTVTLVVDATLAAVNRPLEEIVPLEADQVTAWFEALLTVAENACVPPELRCAEVGDTEMEMAPGAGGGVMVTEVAADLVVSAMLVAWTITFLVAVTKGAVNIPLAEMLPSEEDQAREVLAVLLTVAVNCRVVPEATVGPRGEILTLIGELSVRLAMVNAIVASPRSARGRSVTNTRKVNEPAFRGVPRMAPLLRKLNPCGRSPLTRENW